MATNTTNFDLVKPAGSDSYDISSFHNESMDKIDSALQGLGTGLAIISKNNTHVPINEGEYVYIHGHGSLAEGLYKATMNIVNNGTLNNSCVTPVSGGLGKQVATLSNQIGNIYRSIVTGSTATVTINNVNVGAIIFCEYSGKAGIHVLTPNGFTNLVNSNSVISFNSYSNNTLVINNLEQTVLRIGILSA